MTNMILAAVVGFCGALVFGRLLLPVLRRLKLGQKILEVGPNWHKSKEGTPTMGGFFFMLAITAAMVGIGWTQMRDGHYTHLLILGFAWIYGVIGFIDDLAKVRKKRNQGLTAPQKLLLQLSAAAAFLSLMRYTGALSETVTIPFTEIAFTVPWPVYITLGILFITGMVNAVNFTDGLDGLLSGVTLPVAVLFGLMALRADNAGASVFAGAMTGGLLGFLWFNFHPAKVFMGDTGSLFIGGALCGLAFALNDPLILLVIGLVYLVELLSVVLQVTYFKLTGGKRIFKMSPIHHHFEMYGWKEKKIFAVFSLVSVLLCVAGWFA
ncbi:MAG: phospho-N-acetylmuramoyl-pentapeptide-transferase [Oscillospiraceae bacterium]|jgi:phospho-N-acetylmuramoyl-pentapeptide-transferase|nr:phospho-N-acetylmuramoyl-pentapeptide-transferase [Oscillospiraceae bacterium]